MVYVTAIDIEQSYCDCHCCEWAFVGVQWYHHLRLLFMDIIDMPMSSRFPVYPFNSRIKRPLIRYTVLSRATMTTDAAFAVADNGRHFTGVLYALCSAAEYAIKPDGGTEKIQHRLRPVAW